MREDWVVDFGGFVGNFGLIVGFLGWCGNSLELTRFRGPLIL